MLENSSLPPFVFNEIGLFGIEQRRSSFLAIESLCFVLKNQEVTGGDRHLGNESDVFDLESCEFDVREGGKVCLGSRKSTASDVILQRLCSRRK